MYVYSGKVVRPGVVSLPTDDPIPSRLGQTISTSPGDINVGYQYRAE